MLGVIAPHKRIAVRFGVAQRWAAAGSFIILIFMGLAYWSVSRPEEVPAYFILKWSYNGKCTVVTERPESGNYRLIWYSSLRLSVDDKLREFMVSRRCR